MIARSSSENASEPDFLLPEETALRAHRCRFGSVRDSSTAPENGVSSRLKAPPTSSTLISLGFGEKGATTVASGSNFWSIAINSATFTNSIMLCLHSGQRLPQFSLHGRIKG